MSVSRFRGGLAIVLAFLVVGAWERSAAGGAKLWFEDAFKDKLADGWSWVREDAGAWKLDSGTLVLRTSTGGLWQKQNNCKNILLRQPPDGNYAVEALVENEPTNAFEHAGLTLYYDDDNYASLLNEKVGNKVVVQLVSETEGKPKVGFAEKPNEGMKVWLRMVVADSQVRGFYRNSDKDAWLSLGQCGLPGKGQARIGLITGYAAKNAEHWSRFSRFRVTQFDK